MAELEPSYQARLIASMIGCEDTGHLALKIPSRLYDVEYKELAEAVHAFYASAKSNAAKDRCLQFLRQKRVNLPEQVKIYLDLDPELTRVDKELVYAIEMELKVKESAAEMLERIEEDDYQSAADILHIYSSAEEPPTDVLEFGETSQVSRTNPCPTPVPAINDLISGGVCPGELAVILGRAGGGKSAWLIGVACHAALQGKRVLFLTLELSQSAAAGRCVSWLTQVPDNGKSSTLKERKKRIASVKTEMAKKGGKLVTQYLAPFSITLGSALRRLEAENFDLIVIDAPEHLRPPVKGDTDFRHRLRAVISDVLHAAGHYKIPVWISWQARREAYGKAPGMEDVAELIAVARDASLIVGLNTDSEGSGSATATMNVAKNRFGPEGKNILFEVFFDTCRFVENRE